MSGPSAWVPGRFCYPCLGFALACNGAGQSCAIRLIPAKYGLQTKRPRLMAGPFCFLFGVPKGIRTPVAAVKGQCPRPLDDGDRNWTVKIKRLASQPETSNTFAPIAGGKSGGARRDRTADLYNAIVALSQLSYGPFRGGQMYDRVRWLSSESRPAEAVQVL